MDTADIEHEAQKASDGLTTNALIPAAARKGALLHRVRFLEMREVGD
jgi:hypothetical protein